MIDLMKLAGAPALALLLLAGCDDEDVAEAPAEQSIEEEAPATAESIPPEEGAEPDLAATPDEPAEDQVAATPPEPPATGEEATGVAEPTQDQTAATTEPGAEPGAATEGTESVEPAAGSVAVEPGSYSAGGITLVLNEDNTFEMSNSELGQSVQGSYSISGNTMTLSDVSGDQSTAEFPMECSINAAGEGFRITQAQDSCTILDGLEFQPAG